MRVLLVSEPGVDGVFRHVEALAHFLMERRHSVDLAYSDVRGSDRLGDLVSCITAAGGRVLNLKVSNAPAPRDLAALLKLRGFVSATRPDVIHAHSSKAGALSRMLRALGVRQPVFYTPHAYYGMSGRSGMKAAFFNGVERILGRTGISINLSDGEIAYAEQRLHLRREDLRLIPNPVDTRRFVPAALDEKMKLRADLGVPSGALLLGSMGRLAFQKDPVTLYRAFAAALKQDDRLWLYHLGAGELSDECADLAKDLGITGRIIRRPYLSEPLPFYQAIDAMILTSRYEGLSFAVLEALACDLPVVLSEAPGNVDFLKMGLSHAFSGPVEDPVGMAEAVLKWAADFSQKRLSNHRQTAEVRFSQDACFGAIVQEYEARLATAG